jgi:hypothetical protein
MGQNLKIQNEQDYNQELGAQTAANHNRIPQGW